MDAGQFDFYTCGIEQLDLIRPLWEKLRAHDAGLPGHFSAELAAANFDSRKIGMAERSISCSFFIDIAALAGTRNFVAYSISVLTPQKHGELENIFVDERHRRSGLGTELMQRALARFDSLGATRKSVTVLFENATATRFYARFGFLPRTVNLVQVAK